MFLDSKYVMTLPVELQQGCLLMPCVANQLYQETKARKNPTSDGGQRHNINAPAQKTENTPATTIIKNATLSCFVVGDTLKKAIGMPRL